MNLEIVGCSDGNGAIAPVVQNLQAREASKPLTGDAAREKVVSWMKRMTDLPQSARPSGTDLSQDATLSVKVNIYTPAGKSLQQSGAGLRATIM